MCVLCSIRIHSGKRREKKEKKRKEKNNETILIRIYNLVQLDIPFHESFSFQMLSGLPQGW